LHGDPVSRDAPLLWSVPDTANVRRAGVPASLPLDRFVRQVLTQVALGQFQIQLHFSGVGSISIEGHWELYDPDGTLVDASQEHIDRDCYHLHRVLGLPVARFEIDAPRSFTLMFDPAYLLTIFDDSAQYESFSVNIDGMPGIYL
jgi:hypothetical protein